MEHKSNQPHLMKHGGWDKCEMSICRGEVWENTQTDRQTDKQTDRQTDRQTNLQAMWSHPNSSEPTEMGWNNGNEMGDQKMLQTYKIQDCTVYIQDDSKRWTQLKSKRCINTCQTAGCGIPSSLLALWVDLCGLHSKLSWIRLTFSSDTPKNSCAA